MQIIYCDECGRRMSDADLGTGRAVIVNNRVLCFKCSPQDTQQKAAEEALRRRERASSRSPNPLARPVHRTPLHTPAVEPARKGSRRMTAAADPDPQKRNSSRLPPPEATPPPRDASAGPATSARLATRKSNPRISNGSRSKAGAPGTDGAISCRQRDAETGKLVRMAAAGAVAALVVALLLVAGRRISKPAGGSAPARSATEEAASEFGLRKRSPTALPKFEACPPKPLFAGRTVEGWGGLWKDVRHRFAGDEGLLLEGDTGGVVCSWWRGSDFEMSGEAVLEKGTFAVFFRESPPESTHLRLVFRRDSMAMVSWDRSGKGRHTDLSTYPCNASQGISFLLRAVGPALALEVNGQPAVMVSEPSYLRGDQIGLVMEDCRVTLKKLRISALKIEKP